MIEVTQQSRRSFLGAAAVSIMAADMRFRGPAHANANEATQSAWKLAPVRQVRAGVLNVGYVEAGPSDGVPVLLLH